MSWIKTLFSFSLLLLILVLGIVVSLRNPELVTVDFVWLHSPQLSLGLLLVMALFIGCLMGVFANTFWLWRVKSQRNKLQKELTASHKRFEQLQ